MASRMTLIVDHPGAWDLNDALNLDMENSHDQRESRRCKSRKSLAL